MGVNFVLHIPHSSTNTSLEGFKVLNQKLLESDFSKWTDIYTDELFDVGEGVVSTTVVRFDYSRFVCDVERLRQDPLEKEGRGIAYTHTFGGIFNRPVDEAHLKQVMTLYNEHHLRLDSAIKHEHTIIIDCHSFPHTSAEDPMFCIGFNNDFSNPGDKTINAVVDYLKNAGYSVGLNTPFSNSMVAETPIPHKSLMIEVNKDFYLDEFWGKCEDFEAKRTFIQGIYLTIERAMGNM